MTFGQIAAQMWPFWLIGATIIFLTIKSKYKNLVRVEPKAILGFLKFMVLLTIYRVIMFKMFPNADVIQDAKHSLSLIPIMATFTVFWEDPFHGLFLLLLRNWIGTKKWTWPFHLVATLALMLEFGSGHLYQGFFSACLLSLYVPYSVRLGRLYGFGSVIICHILFDFITLLTMKLTLGA